MKSLQKLILSIILMLGLVSPWASFADTKITGLTSLSTMAQTDLFVVAHDPSGTPITQKITLANVIKSQATLATFSNTTYSIQATDKIVAQTGTMSASRTATLPAANAVPAGWSVLVYDQSGTVTSTNSIVVAAAGTDTVNGAASVSIQSAYGARLLISDGSSKWSFDAGVLRASNNLSDLQSASTARTNLGLGNVENTALSTWAGSTNLTTLGTISTGTWSATTVAVNKGGTGQTTYTDGQLLIGNTSTNGLSKATLTAGSNVTITNGNGTITIASTGGSAAYPTNYHGSAVPVSASTTTITVANIAERDSADATNILKTGSTTVDVSTTGLNGIAQSANLSGTVAISGTTVTGTSTTFTSDFVVGDVITTAVQSLLITAVNSNTSITVATTATTETAGKTYKRGGRAPSGTAASAWYYLYAISDGSTPGLILTTRSVANGQTVVDLPSGYTASRQIKFDLRLDSSSLITPFWVTNDPRAPKIWWDFTFDPSTGTPTTSVGTGLGATSFTDVSLVTWVPPNSRNSFLYIQNNIAGNRQYYFRPKGTTHNGVELDIPASPDAKDTFELRTDASQLIQYKVQSSGNSINMSVRGFEITEGN